MLKSILSLIAPMAFLRLYAGGGGGKDGGATDMREQERARQQQVQSAVDAINSSFNSSPATAKLAGIEAPRSSMPSGQDPVWDKLVGDFQRAHAAKFGTFFTRGWDADAGAQAQYGELADQYRKIKQDEALAQAKEQGLDTTPTREGMYKDISGAVRDTALRDLDRQFTQASRQNTFGLARSGLMGGSADAEAGGDLQTRYGEGRIKAQQAGDAAASDLRSQDEKTRQSLISLAQSGLDTGTAASLAAGQMSSAADLAKAQAGTASAGRLFDDMSQAYLTNRYMAARYPNGAPQSNSATSYGATAAFSPSRYTGVAGK